MGDAPAFNLLGRQFRPNDKGFDGASGQPRRDDPVEFEAEDNEADPFGLDQFLSEAQKGKSNMMASFTEGDLDSSSSTSTAAAFKAAARDRPRWRGGVWRGGRWRLSIAYNSCAYIILYIACGTNQYSSTTWSGFSQFKRPQVLSAGS